MRIAGLYINGFGVFRDIKIDNLNPGLNIFMGNNESGKSTLLGFIRSIFFGFPDGRSSENSYPPLAGGRHGGNIVISYNSDMYIVERYPGVRGGKLEVLKPDHTREGKGFLSQMIPVSDRTLFNNIYAFSLSELQTFETLNTESVEEALYSAGAGINLNALAALRSVTEKKEAELFRPRGRKAKINIILARLAAIAKEKKSLTTSVEDYDHIMSLISSHAADIDSLGKEKSDLTIRYKKIEQQSAILPEWINLVLAEQKLNVLEPVESFPSQGITRLEGLKNRLVDLEKERQEKKDEIKQREDILSSLIIDEALLEHASQIRQIERDSMRFDSVDQDMLNIRQELVAGERKLREGLNRLGSSWSEQMLRDFDLSIARHEEVRKYRDTLSEARLNEQRKKEIFNNMLSGLEEADRKFKDMEEPVINDPDALKTLKQACINIQKLETESKMLNEELRHSHDRLNDLQEENSAFEYIYLSGTQNLSFNKVYYLLFVVLLLVSASGFIVGWRWGITGILLLGILAILAWLLRSNKENDTLKREENRKMRSVQIGSKIEDLEKRISHLEKEIAAIDERIFNEKTVLSEAAISTDLSLEETEQRISNQLDILYRWKDVFKARDLAQKRFEDSRVEHEKADTEWKNNLQEWHDWLKAHEFEISLSPEGVIEILSLIASLKEQMEGLERLRTRISSLEKEKSKHIEFVVNTLEACGRKSVGKTEIPVSIHNIIQDLKTTEQALQKRDLLREEIKISKESLDRMEKQADKFRTDIQELMKLGGAVEEEDFRRRGEIFEKRLSIKQEIERREDNIKKLSREPENIERIIEEISKVDSKELEDQKDRIVKGLEEVEKKLNSLTKEQAALEERARQMVNDHRISELRMEEEELKGELTVLSEEWITMRLSRGLIGRTRARYEKERQPEVLSEGSRFFSRMTLRKYKAIVSPIGENRIEVIDQDNNTRTIEVLSRGTAEQLYLALRFGFIREFSKRSASLPIIMDDILVNFDPERAKESMKGIMELSNEHQLLFFTCHPYFAEMFRDEDRNIPIYTITEGEIKKGGLF
jgi:uncharacterized protein YhaN